METLEALLEFCKDCEGRMETPDGICFGFLCEKLRLLMVWHHEGGRWLFVSNFSDDDVLSLIQEVAAHEEKENSSGKQMN
jgi:hypothetical protein